MNEEVQMNIMNQGVFTAQIEKELVRARTIRDFLAMRIKKVERTKIDPTLAAKTSIADIDAKIQELANSEMSEKTKNSFIQKLTWMKKIEEDYAGIKEEAYKKGYIDALKVALQFVSVLPAQ